MIKDAIVCDKIEELEEFCKKNVSTQTFLCITKNPEIEDYVSENNKNIIVKYLESPKTHLDYQEETFEIIDWINDKISKGCDDENKYLYHIGCSLDIGDISHDILEALMIHDMLRNILENYNIGFITCYYNELYASEIENLIYAKKEQGFNLKVISNLKKDSDYFRLWLLNKFGIGVLKAIQTVNSILNHTKSLAQKTKKSKKDFNVLKCDMGIVLYGARQKNYNWTSGYLEELQQNDISSHVIAIDTKVAEQWREWGYSADSPLEYINNKLLRDGYRQYTQDIKRINNELKKNFDNYQHSKLNIEQLKMIIKVHLDYKVFDALILDKCSELYFKLHRFKIIDLNVSSNYMMSKISYYNVKKCGYNTVFKAGVRDLRIMARGLEYEPFGNIPDFEFLVSERDKGKIRDNVRTHRKTYIVKNTAYSDLFYNNVFKDKEYNMDLSVVWAPSYPALGVTNYSSFKRTGELIIDFFNRNNNAKLFIKFHPNQAEQEISGFYAKNRSKNIKFSLKGDNIVKVMENVDIVITNCSLTIIDAVLQQKAVICVVDKVEYELVRQHEKGIVIITKYENLEELLEQLKSNEIYRQQWLDDCLEKQNLYFSSMIERIENKNQRIKILKEIISQSK